METGVAAAPVRGHKETLWLACSKKTCCSQTIIPTGRDVWRISRTLDVEPWSFLVYFQSPQLRRDAFLLDQSGQQFRLALAKQPSRRRVTPAPCTFLLRTRDGAHRCGLGDLRPLVCQCFPAEVADDLVYVPSATGCTCRRWSLTDLDIAEEAGRLAARQAEAAEYCQVVDEWNERVLAAPPDERFDFLGYCSFLLAAYDAMMPPDDRHSPV